ncbi:hypothetical protein R6Q57_010181 [Mikania cordata]
MTRIRLPVPPNVTRMLSTHIMIASISHLLDGPERSLQILRFIEPLERYLMRLLRDLGQLTNRSPSKHYTKCLKLLGFSWEPSEEFANRQGFEKILKDPYGDIMLEMRKESANNARASGHFIINDQDNFNIMCDFPPRMVSQDVWRQLCLIWNTDDWAKKSERGRDNRMKVDSSGSISRHTGGSVGYDEHHIRLEIKLGKKPTFKQLFLHTHLKKESKAKYWVEYYDDNPKGMEFCTNR